MSESHPVSSRSRTYEGHRARSVQGQQQKSPFLFDHLVGAVEEREPDSQAERPGGLEINNEFDFSRLLNRQLGWFVAFKNTASIKADDEFAQKRPASFNATRTGVTFLVGTLTASAAASAFFVWSSL